MTAAELDKMFGELTRWRVVSSLLNNKMWNVVDTKRLDSFDEPHVELCAVTLRVAVKVAAEMNESYDNESKVFTTQKQNQTV